MKASISPSTRCMRASAAAVVAARSSANRTAVPVDPDQPAREPHAGGLQRDQVEVAAVGPADQLQGRLPPGLLGVGHLVDRLGEGAHLVEPPEDVEAAVAARDPRVVAGREGDVASGAGELVGQLDAGGGGAHHQHAALRKLVGVAVGAGRELGDRGGKPVGGAGHVRAVAPARGDDDLGRVPDALVGRDGEPRRRHGAGRARSCPRAPARRRSRRRTRSSARPDRRSCSRRGRRPGTATQAGGPPSWGSAVAGSPSARCASARRGVPARARRGRRPRR